MSDDPWAAFIPSDGGAPQAAAAPAAQPAADPWAAFIPAGGGMQTQADGAPIGLANVPTAASDPIYHGAVPIAQAPDQGAATAFTSGVGGVPIVGPAIEGGLQRLAAGARSMMGGGSYGTELQHVQDMTDIARQQHPAAAFAGDLMGAAAALAPATAAAPAVFGLGGPVTAGRLLAGATSGAGLGAGDAAVRDGTSPADLARGAVGGALGGAAAPVIGAAASRIGSAAAGAFDRAFAPLPPGMSRPTADVITQALANDGVLGQQGAANLAAAGPRAMLADAGGPSLSGALDTALQHGGPGTAAARQAIEARAAGANQDLTGALNQAFGAPQGVATAEAGIRDGSAAARQTAYDAAYAQPIDYTTDHGRALEDMVANRVPPGFIARANSMMRTDGVPPTSQMMARVAPDGSVTYQAMPDVRQVDYITRSLNDVARAGDGQGALGGNTAEGRSYGALAQDLRGALRNAVPEYGQALDTAADPISARNALQFGSTMLRPNVPRDVVANQLQGMTGPELDQVRQGVRSHISDAMANVTSTIANSNLDAGQAWAGVKMLSSDAARDKLGMLLDPAEHANVLGNLDAASQALNLRSAVSRNSATYGRTVAGQTVADAAQPGIFTRMMTAGGLQKMTRAPMEVLTGSTPQDIAARQAAMHGEIASALTGSQGPAASGMLDQIIQGANARDTASSIAGAVPYGQLAHSGIFSSLLALQPALQQYRAQ